MKRLYSSLALACVLSLALLPAAAASPPNLGCARGPGHAGNTSIGAWESWDQATYAAAIDATVGGGAETAALTFAKEDRNGDGFLCVMTQTLPNDASGSSIWFVSHDNVARG